MCMQLLVLVSLLTGLQGCSRSEPRPSSPPAPPAPIAADDDGPRLGFHLPANASAYREHSTGIQATMLQARFDIPQSEVPALAQQLPCRLGPISTGPVEHGSVGTNDRSWWHPEAARRHRACTTIDEDVPSLHNTTIVVDLGGPQRATVYVLVTDD